MVPRRLDQSGRVKLLMRINAAESVLSRISHPATPVYVTDSRFSMRQRVAVEYRPVALALVDRARLIGSALVRLQGFHPIPQTQMAY